MITTHHQRHYMLHKSLWSRLIDDATGFFQSGYREHLIHHQHFHRGYDPEPKVPLACFRISGNRINFHLTSFSHKGKGVYSDSNEGFPLHVMLGDLLGLYG